MQLLDDWNACLSEIRRIDGLSTFLLPIPFATLAAASENRAIILVNISSIGSEAIIIYNTGLAIITLPTSEADLADLSARLREVVQNTAPAHIVNSVMCQLMRRLWDTIVSHVAKYLQETLQLPTGSRVWWCSASAAWSLPLHAAGPYRPKQQNFSDIYTSSYTSSVSALLRSLQKPRPLQHNMPKLLVVAQDNVPGQPELPNAALEARHIASILPDVALVSEAEGTRTAVLERMYDYSSIHFACHGHQDTKEPFNSHFPLLDGPLRLVDILEKQFPHGETAFLAACHSAEGDRKTPDEGIHLVAGMQFAGFRSVVGTLWACEDRDGPVLAEAFHRYLLRVGDGRLDFSRTAEALAHATKGLRKKGVPLTRWIQFVHFGV